MAGSRRHSHLPEAAICLSTVSCISTTRTALTSSGVLERPSTMKLRDDAPQALLELSHRLLHLRDRPQAQHQNHRAQPVFISMYKSHRRSACRSRRGFTDTWLRDADPDSRPQSLSTGALRNLSSMLAPLPAAGFSGGAPSMAHPIEVDAEVAQLVAVQGLDTDQRLLRQRARALQRRQAFVRLRRWS